MPRRRNPQTPPPRPPTEDYWTQFLKAFNLIGIVEPQLTQPPPVAGELKTLRDPMFQKFLYYASQYGAPGNISSFQKLPANEKLYYLKAYQVWTENIKKKKIKV